MEKPIIQSVIFGFGYRARCGKDTAAAWIKLQRGKSPLVFNGYDIRLYSFARALKQEVTAAALKCGGMQRLFVQPQWYVQENGNFLELPKWVQFDPEAPMDDPDCPLGKQRLLLQWWGTNFRRSVNENYWVDKVTKQIAEDKPEIALLTDVRFPNEMSFVQEYGEMIRVDRPDLPPLEGAAGVHASELALSTVPNAEWDFILENNTDLEDFRRRAVLMFDYIMSEHPLQRP